MYAIIVESSLRDSLDRVLCQNVFYGPVTVPCFISGPFQIVEQKSEGKDLLLKQQK